MTEPNPNQSPVASPTLVASPKPAAPRRWLHRDRSFWGMGITQFLGGFNDNLFKQLILLLAVSQAIEKPKDANINAEPNVAAVGAVDDGEDNVAGADEKASRAKSGEDRQGLAMFVFATPFLLLSGFAGYVSDKVSKRNLVLLAKVGEIAVMLLGMGAFYVAGQDGFALLLAVLFLMGLQSTFFGPAKYGILPELLHEKELPKANGLFIMTTFLAIIFGTAMAGWMIEQLGAQIWRGSLVCVGIAILGTITALLIRRTPVANPELPLTASAFVIPRDMREYIASDRFLFATLLATSAFWFVGGLVQPTVNALGKLQLGLGDDKTSYMAAAMGVGIALGCPLAGYLSAGRVAMWLVRVGAAGMLTCLVLLGLPGPGGAHLFGYPGSIPVLVFLGIFAGVFIVPMQVYVQMAPPANKKGRMIAVMAQANWLAIVISALAYMAATNFIEAVNWPPATVFFLAAASVGFVLFAYCWREPPELRGGNGEGVSPLAPAPTPGE